MTIAKLHLLSPVCIKIAKIRLVYLASIIDHGCQASGEHCRLTWKVSDNSNKGSVIKKSKSVASSKSDTRTDDSNVSATVRDIWAKKFAAPSATAGKEAHKENNKTVTTSSNDVHCPVCNLLVPAQDVNSHLDTCLAKSDESKADQDKLSNVDDNPFVLDEDSTDGDIPAKLSCPVCFKLIFQEEMNRHLDFCAT